MRHAGVAAVVCDLASSTTHAACRQQTRDSVAAIRDLIIDLRFTTRLKAMQQLICDSRRIEPHQQQRRAMTLCPKPPSC